MANGMFGANPEMLRQIAGHFDTHSDGARGVADTTRREVDGVEWVGPDADEFRSDYDAYVVTELKALAIVLELKHRELIRQANEQDAASGAGTSGGPGGSGGTAPQGGFDWRGLLKGAWHLFSDLRNPFRGLRFLMEAGYWLTHPGQFGKFFTNSWAGITGRGGNVAASLEAVLGNHPFLKHAYNPLKFITDHMQLKPFSQGWLEPKVGQLVSSVFGGDAQRITTGIQDFLGKEGRLFGRGLGALSIGMDGYSTINNLSQGNYGGAAYSGVKTALGVASFIPGPVGWTAAGISIGLAAYDNIPAVRNTVNAIGSGIANGAKAVAGFLNPFD